MAQFLASRWAEWESLHGPVTEEERALVLDEAFMMEGARDIIARHAADPLETVTPIMLQRGFSFARITAPRRAFILGSSSFARFMATGSRRQDLGDPGAELWMLVARDVAIGSAGHAGFSAFVEADDVRIRKINGAVSGSSTVLASACHDLVEAYARTAQRGLRIQGSWEAPP
ncbi:hypothetical protein MKK82_01265 [Methylobacterium sp. E-046]|nr:hypothetical protein [Methylobacterium sp. E-046]MCJ2097449.1 hypothetical protein [Methylobacterium sp. E-046]